MKRVGEKCGHPHSHLLMGGATWSPKAVTMHQSLMPTADTVAWGAPTMKTSTGATVSKKLADPKDTEKLEAIDKIVRQSTNTCKRTLYLHYTLADDISRAIMERTVSYGGPSNHEKIVFNSTPLSHVHPPDDGTVDSIQLHTHHQELGSGGGG